MFRVYPPIPNTRFGPNISYTAVSRKLDRNESLMIWDSTTTLQDLENAIRYTYDVTKRSSVFYEMSNAISMSRYPGIPVADWRC